MDIRHFTFTPFKMNFVSIKCKDFKRKKEKLIKAFENYPEKLNEFNLFYTNKNNTDVELKKQFCQIMQDEIKILCQEFKAKINLYDVWSVSYEKGQYNPAHNHGSTNLCGILYLNFDKNSPKTTYIQPWNNLADKTVYFTPDIEEGDMIIAPQQVMHFTEPNKIVYKKRIISFDFQAL